MTTTTPRPATQAEQGTTAPRALPRWYRSTVFLKTVMAVTGVMLLLFLTAHMIGNLEVFRGEESFDGYAHWLREIGEPILGHSWFLWILRVVLLAAVLLHIGTATALARRARRARPVRYAHRPPVQGTYAARTMRWGGVIIALFVVYHILDLTAGVLNPVGAPGRPYTNVTADFQLWYVTAVYTVAVLVLGLHLRHGVWSATRTLGRHRPGLERVTSVAATAYAVVMTVGFLSVPFAVAVGWVE
ncbi:succinate dehydrogenase cytochrome b subunit [Allostreptomyces psammosilenae]|uniref:Succinate dehydrogenase / fumarate reductase cytochrome b subunit n=1 Tax=Allostreptomyces psammosilenae TaxID=1892865 RepID=A0A852ZMN0_9ACTN|nr:succinate dehydrogenase cytochrome b subunit [Allostreptomyces psammosilenae]NYI03673.1 succinate dehydrogenase / fumarate reductase cytochrome b subunit [Allostreptomyces psammosilenae]